MCQSALTAMTLARVKKRALRATIKYDDCWVRISWIKHGYLNSDVDIPRDWFTGSCEREYESVVCGLEFEEQN